MRAIAKRATVSVLLAAAVVGWAGSALAKPKKPKLIWQCKCTCVAYDDQGGRWEGKQLSFDTSADCSIGITVGCTVDEGNLNLQGAYASCTGFTKYEKSVVASPVGGVSQPSSPRLSPSAPALRR